MVHKGQIVRLGTPTPSLAPTRTRCGTSRDRRILPGLIGAHVHLSLDAGTDGTDIFVRTRNRDDELLLADMHGRAAAAARFEHATWITGPQTVGYDDTVARRLAEQQTAVTITGSLDRCGPEWGTGA